MYAVYVQNLFVSRLGRIFALVYAKNAGIWAMCKVLDNTRTQFTACLCFTRGSVDCVRHEKYVCIGTKSTYLLQI